MLRTLVRCSCVTLTVIALVQMPARADLSDVLPSLVGSQIVLDNPSHAAHFQASGVAAGQSLNQNLVEELTAFPLASSGASFTYTFDPALGTFTRSTESFGPIFTDRVQTIGKGRANLGLTYLHATYDKLDDLKLDRGLQFQALHEDCCGEHGSVVPAPYFEGDVIGVTTTLDIKTQTTVFYGTYGVTDRFDVEAAVPLIKVDLDGRSHYVINRLSTGAADTTTHRFAGGSDTHDVALSDDATGIGDVLLRGKYRFFDIRLPTGQEKDLLGSGFTQYKLSLLGSAGFGKAGLHGNLGYSTSSGSSDVIQDLPDELSYSLGVDFAVHPRATLVGEVLGRTLYDAQRAELGNITHVYRAGSEEGPVETTTLPAVLFVEDDLSELLGSVGVKFNPGGNVLVTVGGLFPLSNRGLQTGGATVVLGVESSF
jgi:hypothetical protein